MSRSETADEALVAAARDGDREALERLLRRHHARVYAICRRMAGNDADAEDATQEAMLAAVRGLARFDGRAAFTTWLYRIAVNACLDELRRRRRRPDPTDEPDRAAPARSDGRPDLQQTVSDRMSIDEALGRLHPDFRAAVVLRDQLGLDYAELARVLEVPVGTVKSRIARARAQLVGELGNPGPVGNVQGGTR